jgi:V/A-type H+-transporting ATPase subunit I
VLKVGEKKMGIARLARASLIVPRAELNEALKELTLFTWFHPSEEEVKQDERISELALRALRVKVTINEALEELNFKASEGVIEALKTSKEHQRVKKSAKDWEDFVAKIEDEAKPLLNEIKRIVSKKNSIQKNLADNEALLAALQMVSGFKVDLGVMNKVKRFAITFGIVATRDLKEIRRTLADYIFVDTPLTKVDSAYLVASPADEAEHVDRILRSYDVKPFTIPAELPQNPSKAYEFVRRKVEELRFQLNRYQKIIEDLKDRIGERLLALKEAADLAQQVLEKMRRTGLLTRFSVINGYIPLNMVSKFNEVFSQRWITYVEEVNEHHVSKKENPPTLMTNKNYIDAFENITMNQGPPKYDEIDPTPIISLFFPIFYGIMFADFGQGLVLLFLGLFLRSRAERNIKKWGTMITAAGAAASLMGLIIGEAFGFEIGSLVPFLHSIGYKPLIEIIERAHGVESLSGEAIMTFLKIALIIGMIHLTLGHVLNVVKAFKEGEVVEAIIERIPTLIFYISFLLFGLCIISDPSATTNPLKLLQSKGYVPVLNMLLPISIPIAISISLPLLLISVIIMIVGKPIAIKLGKVHSEESVGMALFMGIIEILEKIASSLANTISYARLAILLFVHSALLMVLNMASHAPLSIAMPILFVGNIGIIALEAIIVYIQDLRLHLYEWFTKFYEGTGVVFRRIMPDSKLVEIEWEK